MGTARYVGMGGAMTAIGGDPTSVMDNTAGLGLYRRPEVTLTLDYSHFVMAPQTSVVFSFPTEQLGISGIQYHNFMFSYHRVHDFYQNGSFTAAHQPSLGALFAAAQGDMGLPFCSDRYNEANAMQLTERGYINEYAFNYAMNISDRWYWGLGLRIHSYSMSSDADYIETFPEKNAQQQSFYNRSRTTLLLNGAGCSLSTGLIYRPLSWLRLGLGLETPSIGRESASTSGTFDAMTDSLHWNDAPNLHSAASDFHMPLHLSTSVAFQISQYAMIAMQYDFRHNSSAPNMHSLRAGLEIVPIAGLYINGGYVFESTFSNTSRAVAIDPTLQRQDAYYQYTRRQQYISCAAGWRGRYIMAQVAYQYHRQHAALYAHQNADPYANHTTTHRVVLTVGWHGR